MTRQEARRAAGPTGTPKESPSKAAAEPTLDNDELAVLIPEARTTVRDPDTGEAVTLTLREFRFEEGLAATAIARPFIADMAALVPAKPGAALPDALVFDDVIAAHAETWLDLVARACGREPAWIARLADGDAFNVRLAMWEANGPFFARRLALLIAEGGPLTGLFRSLVSSTSSSAPATDAATET